jgi:hypothetical protein
MFSVCVCARARVFLCLCTGRRGRGLATSCSPAQGVLPTVKREFHGSRPRPKLGLLSQRKNLSVNGIVNFRLFPDSD